MPLATPQENDDSIDLREYLAVLRRQWSIVAITATIVVAVALGVSFLQTPVYESRVEVLLQGRPSEGIFAPDNAAVRADPSRIQTEIGVMRSLSVREAVAEELGSPVEVSIEAQGETDLITVSAENTDPEEAARTANTYVEVYIEAQRQLQLTDLQTTIDEVQSKITEIEGQLEPLDDPLDALDAQIAVTSSPSELAELEAQRAGLAAEVAARRSLIENERAPYLEVLRQSQLAIGLTQTGGVQVVSRGLVPEEPVRPTPLRSGAVALVVGAMLGVAVAFLREHLDDTIKTKDDLQHASGGLNVLGLIPSVEGWKDRTAAQVVSLTEPTSAAAEAYRALRTSVQFIGVDRPIKVVQFTSPNASEGKTTTLANLAVALARAGQRVIVVCCDLRRPRVHEFLGLAGAPGFTNVLLGESPVSTVIQGVRNQGRLALVAAGPPPPNPSELLASQRALEVLELLKSECDVLLVDSPPILPVTDGLVISRYVDATIVVATSGRTTRKEMQRCVELLQQMDAPLVGTVLNGVESGGMYGYDGPYGYGSSSPPVEGAGAGDADGDGDGDGSQQNGGLAGMFTTNGTTTDEAPPNGAAANGKARGKQKRQGTKP